MSSSSLLRLISVLVELAIVALLTLPPVLLLLFFFLNQLLLLLVLAASVSDNAESTKVGSVVVDVILRFEESLVRWLESRGSAESSIGLCFGVGTGVISVDGVASTSSASRYHFRRRV